jgi:glycosyltransferase involved in cell wall biosynthesis
MRIPYEGMLAALALEGLPLKKRPPLLVSIWGNDFTLHACSNLWMAALTRRSLRTASAVHADCFRDVRLAREWGFGPGRLTIVLPGAGGVQTDLFRPPDDGADRPAWVINPRGIRAYVRTDTFFRAVPAVLEACPQARFICPGMAGEAEALGWVERLGVGAAVELLPRQTRPQMAELFGRAAVMVSPSTHDGTPNTLLEGMACGCFPVVGDLESIREWIAPGVNGLLVDPADPAALAQAVRIGLERSDLRARALKINLRRIVDRAEHEGVMDAAQRFYRDLIA